MLPTTALLVTPCVAPGRSCSDTADSNDSSVWSFKPSELKKLTLSLQGIVMVKLATRGRYANVCLLSLWIRPSSQSHPSQRFRRGCFARSYLVLCSSSPARCKSWTRCRRRPPPAAGDGSPSSAPPPARRRRRAALQRDHLRGGDRNTTLCYGYIKKKKKRRETQASPSRGSNTQVEFLQRRETFFLPQPFFKWPKPEIKPGGSRREEAARQKKLLVQPVNSCS